MSGIKLNFIKAMKLCRMGYKIRCVEWKDENTFIYADGLGFLHSSIDNELYSPTLDDILEFEWEVYK